MELSKSIKELIGNKEYIDSEYKREDSDMIFLKMAFLIAERSHDRDTHHGILLVKNGIVLSTGFNGFNRGSPDDQIPNTRPYKNIWMIHAEQNSIYNAARVGIAIEGATAYVTGKPCSECTKALIQSGVTNWVIGTRGHSKADEQKELCDWFIQTFGVKIKIIEMDK